MPDFQFLHNPYSKQWVVLSPKRAKRPDEEDHKKSAACPFDIGSGGDNEEVYRVPEGSAPADWQVRVMYNKFPFAPVHEIIVHSPDHEKNFDQLPLEQNELILRVFAERYNTHKEKGNVVIFHNYGKESGASLIHPHSQLVVTPREVSLDVPPFVAPDNDREETQHFALFCPQTSQWPDEVWVAPKQNKETFGEITDDEIADLAFILQRLIHIMKVRHDNDFSFNFYITPWTNWYLRLIPRLKKPGGFELATNVYVNTQDPSETIAFIKEHFRHPDIAMIKEKHQALYHRGV